MGRTLGATQEANSQSWPRAGWIDAVCTGAAKWKSPKKGTGAVMLAWQSLDGEYAWEDPLFVTEKALPRLVLVAKRVCDAPADMVLPDKDSEACATLTRYIIENATGHRARVLIEVNTEKVMIERGPQAGQTVERERSRVAYGGYDRFVAASPTAARRPDDDPEPPAEDQGEVVNESIPTGDTIPF